MTAFDGILFLPGMMCDARLFAPQMARLGRRYPVSCADLGRDDSIAGMAARVLRTVPPRFVAVGLSMGGIVAFELWRQAPARVAGLVLMDTNARAETPSRQAARAPQIAKARAGHLRAVIAEEMKPSYLGAAARRDAALLNLIVAMAMDLGPAVFVRQSIALRERPDSMATLATIACPTLILCGADDRLCAPAHHAQMACRIKGAQFRVLPGCGHLPTLEAPAQTSALVEAFIQAHFQSPQRPDAQNVQKVNHG
ncbi:MAG: alpha/beta fold hydrolase [Alphaproteobacteria bacterium]|nr:MAG: alpha/beta fold hydrolase [Alphaproteobacteria bacterium]